MNRSIAVNHGALISDLEHAFAQPPPPLPAPHNSSDGSNCPGGLIRNPFELPVGVCVPFSGTASGPPSEIESIAIINVTATSAVGLTYYGGSHPCDGPVSRSFPQLLGKCLAVAGNSGNQWERLTCLELLDDVATPTP